MRGEEQKSTSLTRKGCLKFVKTLLICSLLLFATATNKLACVETCEGIVEKVGSFPYTEGEYFCRVIVHNDCAYLFGGIYPEETGGNHSYFLDILNVSDLTNPSKIGRYDLARYGFTHGVEIRDDILYAFTVWLTKTEAGFHLLLFNISDPISPWLMGNYGEEHIIPWDFALYQNYAFFCSDDTLKIVDCTNKSAPTLAAEQPYPAYFIEISEDILYLLHSSFQAYNLSNPEQPTLIGNYTGKGKRAPVSMAVKDKYIYTGYCWEGLLAVDFTDPTKPKRVAKYSFPRRDFNSGGEIEAIAISGEYLFTCGSELFVFKIKNSNFIWRRDANNIGFGIDLFVEESTIFVISAIGLGIFSFQKQADYLVIGLSIGGGMVVIGVIGTILIFYKRKKKKNNGEKHQ